MVEGATYFEDKPTRDQTLSDLFELEFTQLVASVVTS